MMNGQRGSKVRGASSPQLPVRCAQLSLASNASWHGVRSVLRMQLLEAIRAHGPLTVPQLSAMFGHECTGLYYHMKLLQSAGLVHVTRTGGADAFAASSATVKVKCNLKSAKEGRRLGTIVNGYLDASHKSIAHSASASTRGLPLVGLRWEHLESGEIARIQSLSKQIHRILDGAKARRARTRTPEAALANWHVAVIAAPVPAGQFPIAAIECTS